MHIHTPERGKPPINLLQEHPDTVGGAMLTGMREAIRALRLLEGDNEEIASLLAAHADTSTAKKRRQV